MLQLYSDSGTYGNITFSATLILKDRKECMTFFCKQYKDLASPVVGEILAVQQGLEWIIENASDCMDVEIYVDSMSVGQVLAGNSSGAYSDLWRSLCLLRDCFHMTKIYHVKAHQPTHNPNKTCDMLCSALLKPYKKEAKCTQQLLPS